MMLLLLPLPNAAAAAAAAPDDWPLMIVSGCWVLLIGLGRDTGCQDEGRNGGNRALCNHGYSSWGLCAPYGDCVCLCNLMYYHDDCECIILMR